MNNTTWMSMERYTEKSQRFPGLFPDPPPQEKPVVDLPPAVPEPAQTSEPAEPAVVAQPSRPLNLPVMPASQGYQVNVSSTEDDANDDAVIPEGEKVAQPERPLNLPVMPGLAVKASLPDGEDEGEGDDEVEKDKHKPLNVRLTTLPDSRNVPMSAGSATKKRASPKASKTETAQVKPPLDTCPALTAHKKRQLQAIESDRQTLSALQAAIAELGLEKKLNFMTDPTGSLNAQSSSSVPVAPPAAKN
ncbi:MAG: hypothetical protein HGA90_03710 [Alphaproteobacteria bacterium]|nr:hypothetical protein [Alphaproteobacteria bacterium]